MREFTYGALGVLVIGVVILIAVDRYLRKPQRRYQLR